METRPRRSHHRPLQGKLDTRSLPLPKQFPPTIAAALQSGPGRVWTPVLVRDQPWLSDSASRSHLPSSCWGFFGFLVFGLSPVPGLAFPGVSAPCVRGRACACACVCLCSVPGPSWSLLRFCVACAVAVAPFGRAVRVCLLASCPGRFSGPVSCFFFSPGSRKTHGGSDESGTRPHQLRKSSKLRAQQISRAKVESHSLSALSVYKLRL